MGYYATGVGLIWIEKIHYDTDEFEDVLEKLREYGWEYELSDGGGTSYLLIFSKNSKWRYEEEEKLLVDFLSNPKVLPDSCIELIGESSDSAFWKYTKEESRVLFWEGRITYDAGFPIYYDE